MKGSASTNALGGGLRESTIRGVARLALLALVGLLWLPLAALTIGAASLFGSRARFRVVTFLTPFFCRSMTFCLGLRIRVTGARAPGTYVFVGNHVSYLDIFVAGVGVAGVYVSRHDLKDWPVIGIFARLAGTTFIDRSSLRSAVESSKDIVSRARDRIRVVFFPEGGSSGGGGVDPFKAFLFGGIVEAGLTVQPVTILYHTIGDIPVSPATRDLVFWYLPEQDFAGHAWRLMKLPGVRAEIRFSPPLIPPFPPTREGLRLFVEELRTEVARDLPRWELDIDGEAGVDRTA